MQKKFIKILRSVRKARDISKKYNMAKISSRKKIKQRIRKMELSAFSHIKRQLSEIILFQIFIFKKTNIITFHGACRERWHRWWWWYSSQ
jgi:hypothetical protein